jgi:hypothetical protein
VWHPTVPPIDLDAWPVAPLPGSAPLTTIVRWRGVHDVELNGVRYGQRDKEFPKFFDLPRLTGAGFRIALIGGGRVELESHGWEVVDGGDATSTLDSYRDFIIRSRAEFGIAKQCYVETCGGWISDRSVSYLAAGRPVVVQDTGADETLTQEGGMLTFGNLDEAVSAIADLNANYDHHAAQAAQLAMDHFDAKAVLTRLLADL